MRTEKRIAVFDCRRYNQKLPREQWQLVADTENVTCTITYDLAELPDAYKDNEGRSDEFCRPYVSKTERESAAAKGLTPKHDRIAIRFKVGQNCRWFDKCGKACNRPTNAELDGKRFEVILDYTTKEKNPSNALAPSGHWVNAIMFKPVDDAPFAGVEFESPQAQAEQAPAQAPQPAPAPAPAPAPQPAPAQVQALVGGAEDDDLPF